MLIQTQQGQKLEHHITIDQPNTVAVDILAQKSGLSKQKIKEAMVKGAVWHTKGNKTLRIRRAKKVLHKGEALHVYYDPAVLNKLPPEPMLVADEQYYSVWNKPYGMLSQGSKWGDHCTIARWAETHLEPKRNSFIVHRLDRAANGLIVIAHQKNAAAALSKLFQERQVDKSYRIWVHGDFRNHSASDSSQISVESNIDGRHAKSLFQFVQYNEAKHYSELDVSIETGRKHQIRRHIAELGYPVVGDRLYGNASDYEDLQLSAYRLSFNCPFTKKTKSYLLSEFSCTTHNITYSF